MWTQVFWEELFQEINKALEEFNGPGSGIKKRQLFDVIRFMESKQELSIPLDKREERADGELSIFPSAISQ